MQEIGEARVRDICYMKNFKSNQLVKSFKEILNSFDNADLFLFIYLIYN